jgi:electron transport complex protein RnfG
VSDGASAGGESLRLVATLTVAGLVSGLAIVLAYRWTLPAIRAHQAAALERAVFEVLPGAERMERRVWDGSGLAGAGAGGAAGESVFAGYAADGALVGWAVPAAGAGFQDTIKLIFGLEPSGARTLGMTVLESRETPGLGDKIYKDPKFVGEFRGLAVAPEIKLIKGHGEAPNEVDAITGATISSKAVVRIVNQAAALWRPRLPAPGAEPSAAAGTAAAAPAAQVPPDVERGGPVPGGKPGGRS